jgi:hypothetical protein
VPEDRTRFEHTIQLAGRALLTVAQAQEAVQWVKSLKEEADADMVCRRIFRKLRSASVFIIELLESADAPDNASYRFESVFS